MGRETGVETQEIENEKLLAYFYKIASLFF